MPCKCPECGKSVVPTCVSCGEQFINESGAEQLDKDALRKKIIEEIRRVYSHNSAGCCLHIVLEDGNLETHHIEWCMIRAVERDCVGCERLGRLLLQLTLEEREKIYEEY